VRKLPLTQAIDQLGVMNRKASIVVLKTLRQAIANAVNNHGLKFDDLSIESIIVNEGPRYKRWNAVSRGRAHSIVKATSHVRVVLNVAAGEAAVKPAAKKVEAKAEKVAEEAAPAETKAKKSTKEAKK
jgi:large subunit ribosomal protein L22